MSNIILSTIFEYYHPKKKRVHVCSFLSAYFLPHQKTDSITGRYTFILSFCECIRTQNVTYKWYSKMILMVPMFVTLTLPHVSWITEEGRNTVKYVLCYPLLQPMIHHWKRSHTLLKYPLEANHLSQTIIPISKCSKKPDLHCIMWFILSYIYSNT